MPPSQTPKGLGRVTRALQVYDQSSFSGRKVRVYGVDTLLNLYEEETGEAENPHNATWYRVDDGWVYSSFVQPVRNLLNMPLQRIPAGGALAEVTVPFTEAWRNDDGNPTLAYRFYYGSTYWLNGVVTDNKDKVWYRILDDRYEVYYYVLAKHLRPVPAEELTPLAPYAAEKRIEVDLSHQRLTAYENGSAVFEARLSSGLPGSATPVGRFQVRLKRPSRHMAADDSGGNGFDLPGVPWVSYFHWTGVAFHGTYWHNDFGRPRSRGCVNLTPADAKWIYRWMLPIVPPGEVYVRDKNGTEVVVF